MATFMSIDPLGQVTIIRMQNRWHEEPSLKNYIKMHGRLPHLTAAIPGLRRSTRKQAICEKPNGKDSQPHQGLACLKQIGQLLPCVNLSILLLKL
jgi:hypothetical protein